MKSLILLSSVSIISLLFAACGLDWTMRAESYEKTYPEKSRDYVHNSYPRAKNFNNDLPPNAEPGKCYA